MLRPSRAPRKARKPQKDESSVTGRAASAAGVKTSRVRGAPSFRVAGHAAPAALPPGCLGRNGNGERTQARFGRRAGAVLQQAQWWRGGGWGLWRHGGRLLKALTPGIGL